MSAVDTLLVVVSLVLAGIFLAAGGAKLFDCSGSREAARSFGVPEQLASAVGLGLPLLELTIGLLLLPASTRWLAAVAAVGLLLAFSIAIAVAMARGKAPDCHCFGQLHSAPAGWSTLARNAALAGTAAFVVVSGRNDAGRGALAWVARLDGVESLVLALALALTGVLAVGGYAVLHVLRNYGRVLKRLDAVEERLRTAGFDLEEPEDVPQLGLAPGTPAPDFTLTSIDGERVGLVDLAAANPVLLLFTSPSCGPCSVLMPTVAEWQRDNADELTVALLSAGDAEAVRAEAATHGVTNVLLDTDLAMYEAYEANGTPSAVLIGDDGTIAAWLAAGSDWIETLVMQAFAGMGRTPGLPLGAELPSLPLSRLDGREVELAEVIERETALVFWNPSCGYCRSLHEDILSWEASPPDGAPALVVVSAGETVGVRAEGFASEVLLDPEWTVSGALGADGTPMAVLVSADGRIASSIAGGGPAVLELLGAGALSTAR